MLEPIEVYKRESLFRKAAIEARYSAKSLGEVTAVCAEGGQWIVLVPPGGNYELAQKTTYQTYEYDSNTESVSEDFASDQDDWARSDEDGWFYED